MADEIIDLGFKKAVKESHELFDNTKWTPEQMLQYALESFKKNKEYKDYTKAIVIFLNDKDCYNASFLASNMRASEIVALLEVLKNGIIKDHIRGGD
jgi:hypothetical protein